MNIFPAKYFTALAFISLLFLGTSWAQTNSVYSQDPQDWRLVFPGLPGSRPDWPLSWGPQAPYAYPLLRISTNVSRADNTTFNALPSLEGLQTPSSATQNFSLRIPMNGTGNCANSSFNPAVHSGGCILTLGPNSQLISTSTDPWPTLPFSLSLGNSSTSARQGFLAFGGAFDAGAVGADQWILLTETTQPGSDFLSTGRVELPSAVLLDFQHKPWGNNVRVVLDFNDEALTFGGLGERITCASSFGIRFTQAAGVISSGHDTDIILGRNVTDASVGDIFYNCDDTGDPSEIVLGKSFFQAAIMYVNETGAVYLTQASQVKGASDWQLFNSQNLTLKNTIAPPTSQSIGTVVSCFATWTIFTASFALLVNFFFLLL